jgi:hypothetical protein
MLSNKNKFNRLVAKGHSISIILLLVHFVPEHELNEYHVIYPLVLMIFLRFQLRKKAAEDVYVGLINDDGLLSVTMN